MTAMMGGEVTTTEVDPGEPQGLHDLYHGRS
jgi:hypothetical protein